MSDGRSKPKGFETWDETEVETDYRMCDVRGVYHGGERGWLHVRREWNGSFEFCGETDSHGDVTVPLTRDEALARWILGEGRINV